MRYTTCWDISKQQQSSQHGLVACQNPKAARAGAAILAQGGNAVDAAVATAATLSVVEPWLSGLGGGGFMVYMDASGQDIRVLDFNMVSPKGLDPKDYPLESGHDGDWFNWPKVQGEKNLLGYTSIGVPGAVAGLNEALRCLGTLSWGEVLAPALREAEEGLEVDWFAALAIAMDSNTLAQFPTSTDMFLRDGRAPRLLDGKTVRLPMEATAAMLRRLCRYGAEDFYTGELGEALIQELSAGGSALTMDDMAAFRPAWHSPLRGSYRDWELAVMPGLSAGPSLLRTLRHLEDLLPSAPQRLDAATALAYAQALRATYEERLSSMGHAALAPGCDTSPKGVDSGCTSNLCVVDAEGNMVALTNTLLSRFGSKVVASSVGLCMNNALMWFDPRPNQPNSLAPGVKPLANMCPTLLWKEGQARYALGAAGGRTIFPTLTQIISYVTDMGYSLEQAFCTPRLCAASPTIKVNAKAGQDTYETLRAHFPTVCVEDTVYPVHFSIPTAVSLDLTTRQKYAMAHHNSPWATTAEGCTL